MFRFISKKIKYASLKKQNSFQADKPAEKVNRPLSSELKNNLQVIKDAMHNSSDVVVHEFNFGRHREKSGALVYIDSMVDKSAIHRNILKPLMFDNLMLPGNEAASYSNIDGIEKNILSITGSQKITQLENIIDNLLTGDTILLVDGSKEALSVSARRWEFRSIEEPQTESVVRGPREGFTEDIKVNITLLRRKIKDPDLCFEEYTIGVRSKTIVCIAYLKSIASPQLIEEIRARLARIKIDGIFESGYIEQFIEDNPYSVFSTISNSEKPDKIAAKILEGRAAILVDGTPMALCAPMLFISSFQSEEDYYSRPFFASFLRILRFISYIISTLAPAIYVALTVYHQELIPTPLLISIAAGRELVPFPAVLEALIMLFTFDILREAGVRLPKPVGSAVSIVGALVLGQSAVQAGLISPLMVIVVAATAISSFVVPAQTDSSSILRYFFLFLAGLAGGFGILMGILVVLLHLASLRSFGVPYLAPLAPLVPSDLKDSIIRLPLWALKTRPKALKPQERTRQGEGMVPSPLKRRSGGSKRRVKPNEE